MWHRARPIAAMPDWATFHDLRHFYASLLIAKGCSVKAVQRRLGHQSAMETLDTYGHLWPDSDDETATPSTLSSVASQGRAEIQSLLSKRRLDGAPSTRRF